MKGTRCEEEQVGAPPDVVGQLLYKLKVTVERVLVSRLGGVGANVWLAYGGLVDLVVTCIGDILKYGLKSRVRDDESILEWLKKSFDYPVVNVNQWLRDSLLQYCLKDQFVHLLHNRSAVEDIYSPDAFLRLPPYVESLFLCLTSLEEQQHKFLTEIDPALYMVSLYGKSLNEMRSLSFPVLSTSVRKFTSVECCATDSAADRSTSAVDDQATTRCCQNDFCFHCVNEVVTKLVSTVSAHVQDEEQQRNDSRSLDDGSSTSSKSIVASTSTSSLKLPGLVSRNQTATHRRTRSDDAFLRRLPIVDNRLGDSGSLSTSGSRQNVAEFMKESWLEAAKLRDYITQREYETSLELERENAHFLLSEMLIGAIEQMKWRNVLSSQWPNYVPPPSDPPPPSRPRTNVEEELASASYEGLSDSSGDNYYFSNSSSGDLSSWNRDSAQQNLSTVDEGVGGRGEIGDGRQAGPSVDAGYSTDGQRSIIREPSQTLVPSAESVAMNLLQRFSQRHFPPAESDELKFLVSYKDVPQLLLPLPRSMPVAPDEVYAEGFKQKVKLRGTFEWAPPRPQLIFKMHSVPKLKPLLEQQSYKCAGCGMKLDKAYVKRLRYCAYLGKLFCQCCHQGQTATIPGHVLHQWDFRRLPVSDFSYRFLSQQYAAPVWNVKAVNESLYNSIKQLRAVKRVRQQVRICYDYVRTCRLAKELITTNGRLSEVFEKMPPHLIQETDVYSMQDFAQVKDGTLYCKLEAAVLLARYHIESCQYCRAKGFVCEVCRKDEILFPFQADSRVKRCAQCGSCFHVKCLRKRECPKCRRLQLRRNLVSQDILEQEDELES